MTTDLIAAELRGIKREIFETVAWAGAAGIARDHLAALVYPKGPPKSALKVHIWRLNWENLSKHGLRIRSSRRKIGRAHV